MQLSVELICNGQNSGSPKFTYLTFEEREKSGDYNKCIYKVQAETVYGCPVTSVNAIFAFLE